MDKQRGMIVIDDSLPCQGGSLHTHSLQPVRDARLFSSFQRSPEMVQYHVTERPTVTTYKGAPLQSSEMFLKVSIAQNIQQSQLMGLEAFRSTNKQTNEQKVTDETATEREF